MKIYNVGDGGYGRTMSIRTPYQAICDVCKKWKTVISFDSSDGEYSDIRICMECVNKVFSQNQDLDSKLKEIESNEDED